MASSCQRRCKDGFCGLELGVASNSSEALLCEHGAKFLNMLFQTLRAAQVTRWRVHAQGDAAASG